LTGQRPKYAVEAASTPYSDAMCNVIRSSNNDGVQRVMHSRDLHEDNKS